MPVLELSCPVGGTTSLDCQPGQSLSEAIWLADGIQPQPLCAGLGRCGRCRIRFLEEAPAPTEADRARFSETELASGWRLACHHKAPECAKIKIFLPQNPFRQPEKLAQATNLVPVWLGIDLGTTSIQWQALSHTNPDADHGAAPNPQAGAGADVISRLAFAANPAGQARLGRLVLDTIGRIVTNLGQSGYEPVRACIAANSAMTEILLGCDVGGLLKAPYSLSYQGAEIINLDLPYFVKPLPTLIPPLPGPFIGGDVSAGLLTLAEKPKPFILADLGTNAELALLDGQNQLWLASAPLGPALEGVGPACGQPAGPGVITNFQLGPSGLIPHFYDVARTDPAMGISGSGYLSLLAILLNTGVVNPQGQFNSNPVLPLARKIAPPAIKERLHLPYNQYLTSFDIEMMLKVKAAFAVALQKLLAAGQIAPAEIQAIYLAGALGEFTASADLADLGFIPPLLAKKAIPAGNTSLKGACILAREPAKMDWLAQLCSQARIIQLADEPDFLPAYMAAMQWGNDARV